ncbi:MAG: GCN5 family acetyltransferase [Clostridia bacterium BRH_c25]|nr:MAG: GCN5 family acetyltransferase [Clostridia bacterium BRH_c25]
MLEEIDKLPYKVVKDLEMDIKALKVYLVQDFDLKLLRRIVSFGLNIFGELGMDEWGLVPQIRHGNVYILKKEGKKEIIGLAILMRDWEDFYKAYLFDYAIAEEFRGHGFGYEFMKIIIENLAEQGFDKLSLTVDVENKSAIKLYQDKIGFESILLKTDEYGKGHDRYIMELDLLEFLEKK